MLIQIESWPGHVSYLRDIGPTLSVLCPTDDELTKKLALSTEVQRLTVWIYENIVKTMVSPDTYKTHSVKLRIATGMINKITCLDDEEKRTIHYNMIKNIDDEYYRLLCDDLPF